MSKNDVTGDDLKSKVVNDLYRDGFDRIFGSMMKNRDDVLKPKDGSDIMNSSPTRSDEDVS